MPPRSGMTYRRVALGLGVLTLWAVLAGTALANAGVYRRLVRATGWVWNFEKGGKKSAGTCWLLSRRDRLAITNSHVVARRRRLLVTFPEYQGGKLVRDPAYYRDKARHIPCRVLAVDTRRDLALLRLDRVPDHARSLRLASRRARRGETVYGVGTSGGGRKGSRLWTAFRGKVRKHEFYKGRQTNGRYHAGDTIKTTCRTYPGDSGSPVVNRRGRVVGVHFCNNDKGDSWEVDVRAVRRFLKRNAGRRT